MPEIVEFVPEETPLAPPVTPDTKPEGDIKEAGGGEDFVIEEEGLEAGLPPGKKAEPGEDTEKDSLKKQLSEKDQELMKLAWRLEQIEQGLKEKPVATAPAKTDEPEYTDAQLEKYLDEQGNSPAAFIQVQNYIAQREARKQRAEAEKMYATGQTAKEFRDLETQVLGNRSDIKDPVISGKVANLRKSFNLDHHPGGNLLAYALYKFWESEESQQKAAATEAREKKAKASNMDKSKTTPKDKGNGLTPEHLAMAEKLGIKDVKLYAKFVSQAEGD